MISPRGKGCITILAVITLANLRGTVDAGRLFAPPTYLFIASFLVLIALGAVTLAGGAVAFSIIRRSSRPEPSAASQSRPPSVDVAPKP